MTSDRRRILLTGLRRTLKRCGGRYSLTAKNLESGEQILISPDIPFPAASVIKVPVLAALFALCDSGRLSLEDLAEFKESDKVGGSGVLLEMHPRLQVTLRDLAHLMIVVSDNTATNMLIDRIGLPEIDSFMRSLGFRETRLQRLLFDLEARAKGRDNIITAGEIASLYEMLHNRNVPGLHADSCDECLKILGRQQHREKIPDLLPSGTKVASKPGGLDDISHDSALVMPKDGPVFTLVVCTADFTEKRLAETAIARVSRMVFDYFTAGR